MTPQHLLIIDPHPTLERWPYRYFSNQQYRTTLLSLDQAKDSLTRVWHESLPTAVVISSSFSIHENLDLLERIHILCKGSIHLPILLWTVEWLTETVSIPTTPWGGKVGILDAHATEEEIRLLLNRLRF